MHWKMLYMGLFIHYANKSMQYAGSLKTVKMLILDENF